MYFGVSMARCQRQSADALAVAVFLQLVLIEAEVVTYLVQQRYADLFDDLLGCVATPLDGSLEQVYQVGEVGQFAPAVGERDAHVQSQKIIGLGVSQVGQKVGAGPLLHHHVQVIEGTDHVFRQFLVCLLHKPQEATPCETHH